MAMHRQMVMALRDPSAGIGIDLGEAVRHERGACVACPLRGHEDVDVADEARSEEHTSEIQSLMRNSYAVFCLKKKKTRQDKMQQTIHTIHQKQNSSSMTQETQQTN